MVDIHSLIHHNWYKLYRDSSTNKKLSNWKMPLMGFTPTSGSLIPIYLPAPLSFSLLKQRCFKSTISIKVLFQSIKIQLMEDYYLVAANI